MSLPYETLKKRSQFVQVARKGDRSFSSLCSIQFLKNSDSFGLRVGFTATKRLGNAVCRNRAKRRMRALVRELMMECAFVRGDYVLISQKDMLLLPYGDIRDRLKRTLLNKGWASHSKESESL